MLTYLWPNQKPPMKFKTLTLQNEKITVTKLLYKVTLKSLNKLQNGPLINTFALNTLYRYAENPSENKPEGTVKAYIIYKGLLSPNSEIDKKMRAIILYHKKKNKKGK